MKNRWEQDLVLTAAWGFVLTALALVSQRTLCAEEPKTADATAPRHQLRVEIRGSVPWLDKIPMVKTLIGAALETSADHPAKSHTVCPGSCVEQAGDQQLLVIAQQAGAEDLPQECRENQECRARQESQECRESLTCRDCVNAPCCPNGQIAQCKATDARCDVHQEAVLAKTGCSPPGPCCPGGFVEVARASHESCEQVAELKSEIASLRAQRDAQELVMESRCEMLGELVGALRAKAEAEARLELAAAHQEAQQRMHELMAENARLKTSLELAETRHSMLKETLEVAVENERLRLRVAELEQRQSAGRETRTAKKPRPESEPHTK